MSDQQLRIQHDEVKRRRQQQRLADLAESARISAANNRRHGR